MIERIELVAVRESSFFLLDINLIRLLLISRFFFLDSHSTKFKLI